MATRISGAVLAILATYLTVATAASSSNQTSSSTDEKQNPLGYLPSNVLSTIGLSEFRDVARVYEVLYPKHTVFALISCLALTRTQLYSRPLLCSPYARRGPHTYVAGFHVSYKIHAGHDHSRVL